MSEKKDHKNTLFKLRQDVLVCLFLVIATLAVYWQVQRFDFVNFDDNEYVYENRHVQNGLTLENIIWAFSTTHAGNWHPLTWLSHMLDCQLFGLNPGRHHLANLLFHIVNSLLLFCVFRKMTGGLWQSAFVAALFALHPLHVESVAWVSERKDVLSTFFWILTMGSYIRYVEHSAAKRYFWVVLFFALGLLSKPMLVTLPFVLLLVDYWPLNRLQLARSDTGGNSRQRSPALHLVWEKAPLFVLVAISSAMTFYAENLEGAVKSLDVIPFKARIANALISYIRYIGMMVYPSDMAVLYLHTGMLSWWQITGACLLLGSISFWAIKHIKQKPYVTVGWLWYLGTLVPVIGLVQVGMQSMADRYTYVPFIGLFIIVAWGIPELTAQWQYQKKWLAILSTIVLSAFIAVAWKQTGHWKNSTTLFEHTLKYTNNNYVAHNNLGNALYQQGRNKEAIEHFLQAIRIRSIDVNAHNNLALALEKQGRVEEAIEHYLTVLRIKPDFEKTHNNLGNALDKKGRVEEAIEHYVKALQIKPDYEEAHNNLGLALEKQGRIEEAIEHYAQALKIRPDYAEAKYNIGNALEKQGNIEEAIEHYIEALRINPDYGQAHNNLGIVLYKQGRTKEAIEHLLKAQQINPDSAKAHYNLGLILIGEDRPGEAIEHFVKALRIKPDFEKVHNELGAALVRTGKIDEAIIHFRTALQIDPDNSEALDNLNQTLAALKKIDREINDIQNQLTTSPQSPVLHFSLGNMYKMKGQSDKAQAYYAKALSLQPEFPEALYELAKLYISQSEYEKALSLYRQMISFLPDNPIGYYNIACIYARQNRPDESVSWLQKAVARGLDDWNHIKTDKDLDNIRNADQYKVFIKGH